MIALCGGRYNGRYAKVDPMPAGSAVLVGPKHSRYIVQPGGYATPDDRGAVFLSSWQMAAYDEPLPVMSVRPGH